MKTQESGMNLTKKVFTEYSSSISKCSQQPLVSLEKLYVITNVLYVGFKADAVEHYKFPPPAVVIGSKFSVHTVGSIHRSSDDLNRKKKNQAALFEYSTKLSHV